MEVKTNSSIPKKLTILPLVFLLSLGISACGGGSSGTPPADDPPAVAATVLNKSVTGQVTAGVSGSASTAAGTPDNNAQSLENVQVQAILFSGDVEIETFTTTTDSNGAFRLSISEKEDQLIDRVDLTFEKDGYTIGKKTVEPTENTVVITRLGPVSVVTQSRDQLAFTASGAPAFRFALIKQADGTIASVAGSQLGEARAAAGAETLLDMSLPATSVAETVTAVTAKIAHFDPNDLNQVQAFPGDFIGSGEVGSGEGVNTGATTSTAARIAAGEEEYRLISSVFSQVDLVDQNGDVIELTEPAAATTAADGDNPVMYLSLPLQSYGTISSDQDDTIAGIQVPIFVYKDGWQYVGNGTLVTFDGTNYQTSTTPLPLGTTNLGLFVKIEITDGNEWIQWVNLDWPIKASTEVKRICFGGNIVYSGDEQEKFNGNLNITLPDGGYDWPYVQNGVINIDKLVFSNDATDSSKWEFSVWNQRAFRYESIDLSSMGTFTLTTSGACNFNDLGTTELTNPRQYRLYGKATKNGNPVSGLTLSVNGDRFWDWAVTDVNGEYTMNVPGSELNYNFAGDTETGSVQVNGTVVAPESLDDGNAVRLDFALANVAPQLTSYFAPNRLIIPASESSVSTSIVVSAYDVDSDDINFVWSCSPSATCSIAKAASTASIFDSEVATFTATAEGEYDITVTVSDLEGGSVTKTSQINVEQGNRKPRAVSVRKVVGANTSILSCNRTPASLNCRDELRANDTGSYEVVYFDPDGDAVTVTWDGFGCAAGDSCTYTAIANGVLAASLTDGNKSDSARITMTVAANQPPEIIFAFASPANIRVDQGGSNPVAVLLEGAAIDDVSINTESWSVIADNDTSETDLLSGSTSGSESLAIGALNEGIYTATYTVTDGEGASSSQSRKIRVFSNEPPVITSVSVSSAVILAGTAEVTLTAVATDAESDPLTYNWSISGTSTQLTGDSATLPTSSLASGSYTATVVVSDGTNSSTDTVSFRVNTAPVISSPADASTVNISEEEGLTLQAAATDDITASQALTYAWSLDSSSVGTDASIFIQGNTLSVGNHTATVTVTDGDGASTTHTVTIVVAARINEAPVISIPSNGGTYTFTDDQAVVISSQVTDDVSTTFTYAWTVNSSAVGSGSELSLTVGTLAIGTHTGSLTVTDGDGATASNSFTIEVVAKNDGNLEIIID